LSPYNRAVTQSNPLEHFYPGTQPHIISDSHLTNGESLSSDRAPLLYTMITIDNITISRYGTVATDMHSALAAAVYNDVVANSRVITDNDGTIPEKTHAGINYHPLAQSYIPIHEMNIPQQLKAPVGTGRLINKYLLTPALEQLFQEFIYFVNQVHINLNWNTA
jgi:hypothetical protein